MTRRLPDALLVEPAPAGALITGMAITTRTAVPEADVGALLAEAAKAGVRTIDLREPSK